MVMEPQILGAMYGDGPLKGMSVAFELSFSWEAPLILKP